jgi:NADH dehydrogenase FAD-containing subunit
VPYSTSREGHGNNFDYIQGELTTVNKDNTITIKAPNGSTKSVPYDYLVIATGFKYSTPYKNDANRQLKDRKTEVNSYYDKV